MSVSATMVWRGVNKVAILNALTQDQQAALETMRPIIGEIITMTVGTQYYGLAALRQMKYPYRLGGSPPLPYGVVNRQSGRFLESMQILGPTRIGDLVIISLVSLDEDRAWQLKGGGNSRMPPRPYKILMQDRFRRAAAQQLVTALKVRVAA